MGFLKRHIAPIIAVLACVLVLVGVGSAFAASVPAVPDNPAGTYDEHASTVAWTGEGWVAPVNEESPEDEHAERDEPDREPLVAELPPDAPEPPEDARQPAEEEPDLATDASRTEATDDPAGEQGGKQGDRPGGKSGGESNDGPGGEPGLEEPTTVDFDDDDPSSGAPVQRPDDKDDDEGPGEPPPDPDEGQEPGPEDPNEGMYPLITTDLRDGEEIGQDWRTFTVRATDWEGRYIDSSGVRVTAASGGGDPARLYVTSDDGYELKYRLPVDARDVAVAIRATDAKGRSSMLELTVHRAEEDTEAVVDGSITLTLEAGTVGLGRLYGPREIDFYEGEQMSSVFCRAMDEAGFGVIYKGSIERSFYLQHVTRAGITDGWEIPAKLQAHLDEVGYTPTDYHQDSLGEYDFTGTAGWMYSVNDVLMSTNMSNYYPADGDEVRVRFTLYRGSDIGGDDGPQWEEEW